MQDGPGGGETNHFLSNNPRGLGLPSGSAPHRHSETPILKLHSWYLPAGALVASFLNGSTQGVSSEAVCVAGRGEGKGEGRECKGWEWARGSLGTKREPEGLVLVQHAPLTGTVGLQGTHHTARVHQTELPGHVLGGLGDGR